MVAHSTLTGSDLHEPKGVASANSGEVYIANGSGSGVWTKINGTNRVYLSFKMENISSAASHWIVPGVAGDIIGIKTVINGAIASADCGLSFEIAGTLITGGNITIAFSGSSAGDVDSSTPSAANTITDTDAIEMITDGGSTNDVDATITFIIDIS